MRWSKLKKQIETNICDSLKGRVEFHSTRYRGTKNDEGRGWITIDKKDIFSFCTTAWINKYKDLDKLIDNIDDRINSEKTKNDHYFFPNNDTHNILKKQGVYSQYEFYYALETFSNLSITNALKSNNTIIVALAIIDKRLGKRRFLNLNFEFGEKALAYTLYRLRSEAENWRCCATINSTPPNI